MTLGAALERAALALPAASEAMRAAHGSPERLLAALEPETAARLLGWLFGEAPAAGRELAAAWAELPGGEKPLLELQEQELPKPARKELRRALHRLRSRGVALPRPPAGPVVASLPPLEDELVGALVSPLDPSGAQLLVIVEPNPSGGARLFQAVIDDERGILEFQAFSASRSQARRLLRDLRNQAPLPAVPAPPDAVRARLAGALATHPTDRALPRGMSEWRARVAAAPSGARAPGELAREALAEQVEPALLRRAVELVERGEVGPWPPSGTRLREFAEKLEGAARSRIVLSELQRRERAEALLGELASDRFETRAAEQAATRWEETAYVLWKRERDQDARACLAAAHAFRSVAPERNPVARALLERALEPVRAALREEERASLLIKP